MTPEDLKQRLTTFAVLVFQFCIELRARPGFRRIADQLSDSATSTSANYRSACRARSLREFISKLAIALEEADESAGWLEIICKSGAPSGADADVLLRESREVVAILAASRRTAARRLRDHDPKDRSGPSKE